MERRWLYKRTGFLAVFSTAVLAAVPAVPAAAGGISPEQAFQRPSSGAILPEPSELKDMIRHFSADKRSLDRHFDFTFSPARFARYKAFYSEWLEILDGIDFDGLGLDGRIDYLLLKNHLEVSRHRLDQEETAARDALPILPFAGKIFGLCRDLKEMKWIEGRAAAAALNDLRIEIEKTKKELEVSDGAGFKASAVFRAVSMAAALRRGLEQWFDFYNGYDPLFSWWAAVPYKATDEAFRSFETFLSGGLAGIEPGVEAYALMDPVGQEALVKELAFEMIPYTPEEILAFGWREFDWCEKERAAAVHELGYDTWQEAFEHVKNRCVDPGGQPELIRFMAFEAIDFLEEHNSVTIPPMVKDLIWMEMMPLARMKTTPFFTGGYVISVAYAHESMPFEQKFMTMRSNNPHFSRAVVHHELVPGHNLQGFMEERHRTYRRPFRTSFFGEGWPLYWEMRLWDMDFQKSPEDRIGMLFWRMHRCARIIFSLSYHLEKMNVDECIDLLANRVGHEMQSATVEVKAHLSGRTSYGLNPLAQCSYLVGGLQMRSLSRELVDSGKMTAKAFHDAALLEGSIPIELLRAKLTRQELSPDFKSIWKFYTPSDETAKSYNR